MENNQLHWIANFIWSIQAEDPGKMSYQFMKLLRTLSSVHPETVTGVHPESPVFKEGCC